MNTPIKIAIVAFLASVVVGYSRPLSSSSPAADEPSASKIATSFTTYHQITKNVVFVNPELAMLCSGASKEEMDAAREKFGPHANTGILIYMNDLRPGRLVRTPLHFPSEQ